MSRGPPANLKQFLAKSNINVVRDNSVRRAVVVTKPSKRPRRMNTPSPPSTPPRTARACSVSPVRPKKVRDPRVIRSAEKASPVRKVIVPNPNSTSLVISPLEYTMFNALSKPKKDVKVDVRSITKQYATNTRLVRTKAGVEEFFLVVTKIEYCDSKFKCVPGGSHVAKLTCHLMYTTKKKKNLYVYVFKNGTIRMGGGILDYNNDLAPYIRDHIVDSFIHNNALKGSIDTININAQFRMNGVFRADSLKKALVRHKITYSYEPEIKQNFIKLSYKGHKFQVWFNGVVQTFGHKSRIGTLRAYKVGKELVNMLHTEGVTSIKGAYTATGRSAVAKKQQTNLNKMTKKELMTRARNMGVVLPKHIVKADIIKLISKKNVDGHVDVANKLKNVFGKNWLQKYELYTILDFPNDVRKVKNLLKTVPQNKHNAVMRAYVSKVKKNRIAAYESLLKTLNNVFKK